MAYRTALLCSLVWQCRKRSSLRPLVKTYLPDMVLRGGGRSGRKCSYRQTVSIV